MTATAARALLAELLAATPPPPAPGTDANDVVETAARFVAARERPFASLRALMERDPALLVGDADSARLVAELRERDAGWSAAMKQARVQLSERMASVRRAQRPRGGIRHGR
ncbi:MAG: hypothetical protein D6689_12880 [Deltaproteobacteria bacterium]|nr:MAG: hypothetical protein D6689_12880 [Deltaproteobacteria bacterium]